MVWGTYKLTRWLHRWYMRRILHQNYPSTLYYLWWQWYSASHGAVLVAIVTAHMRSVCACVRMRICARPLARASAVASRSWKAYAYAWSPIDAKIFGVNANMVGIKANANVEITNQNILSKSHCIDSCQYIHFQYLRLDCSKETEQWHMVSGEQETSMSGNGTIWALTR